MLRAALAAPLRRARAGRDRSRGDRPARARAVDPARLPASRAHDRGPGRRGRRRLLGRRADRDRPARRGLQRRLRRLDRGRAPALRSGAGGQRRLRAGVLARHQGLDPAHARGDGRGRGPGGRRPGGLRRGLGGGARLLRARLPAVRSGGRADRGGKVPLPAADGDHPRRGGDGGADARALARSLGRDPDLGRGAGEPGLSRPRRVDARALRGAGRGAAGRRDLRLGRPLGTFEAPQPRRAEAWRSGRSLHDVEVSLQALRGYAATVFAPAIGPDHAAASTRASTRRWRRPGASVSRSTWRWRRHRGGSGSRRCRPRSAGCRTRSPSMSARRSA